MSLMNLPYASTRSRLSYETGNPKLVCYFATWAPQREVPAARMFVEDINPNLCSHLILAFANIDTKHLTIAASDPSSDLNSGKELGTYAKFNRLKRTNPDLVTMIAIGGETAGSAQFKLVCESKTSRDTFSENVVKFLRLYNFSGLDVDWEYPSNKDGTDVTFILLLESLMAAFKKDEEERGITRLVLSAAVGAVKSRIDESYRVSNISKTVDMINLMTYDYAGSWNKITSFNSPLYPRHGNIQFNQQLCQEWSAKYWISKGADRRKLMLGMNSGGRSFKLQDPAKTRVGSKVNGSGDMGKYLKIPGILAYFEICDIIEKGGTQEWDEIQGVPYVHLNSQWVTYDNENSFRLKTQWLLNETLGGAMVWSLDMDDFKGDHCGQGKLPLTSTVRKVIDEFMAPPTTATTRITSIPTRPRAETSTVDSDGNYENGTSSGQTKLGSMELMLLAVVLVLKLTVL